VATRNFVGQDDSVSSLYQILRNALARTFTVSNLAIFAVLTFSYFATGKLGQLLAVPNPSATALWAPTGISLAAVLLRGNRVWPGILLGAFLVNITTTGSIRTSMGIAVGNTLEALVAAYLVTKFADGTDADSPHCFFALQVNRHVALRLRATDEQIARGGWLKRFGLVSDTARD
jgi:glucose-6-phosphate-specific signal transduction histidine kinase